MSIYLFLNEPLKNYNKIKLMNAISSIYGADSFENLMLFDALITNQDRHLGNFGMIIDNNTNEILRPAPIFDNGFSMINTLTQDELKDIQNNLSNHISYFKLQFNKQLKIFSQKRHIPNLKKLKTFKFKKHKEFNLSEKCLQSIEES